VEDKKLTHMPPKRERTVPENEIMKLSPLSGAEAPYLMLSPFRTNAQKIGLLVRILTGNPSPWFTAVPGDHKEQNEPGIRRLAANHELAFDGKLRKRGVA
jgi:hypothetical protein